MTSLRLVPIHLREAKRFVAEHHRHNLAPVGWQFGTSVEDEGRRVGVAVAGRPVGRGLDDGVTIEVTRTCTDGTRNANSKLYGAINRAAQALGYCRSITYTSEDEPGSSLLAAGFVIDAYLPARDAWIYAGQGRYQHDLFGNERRPPGPKIRWIRWLA